MPSSDQQLSLYSVAFHNTCGFRVGLCNEIFIDSLRYSLSYEYMQLLKVIRGTPLNTVASYSGSFSRADRGNEPGDEAMNTVGS